MKSMTVIIPLDSEWGIEFEIDYEDNFGIVTVKVPLGREVIGTVEKGLDVEGLIPSALEVFEQYRWSRDQSEPNWEGRVRLPPRDPKIDQQLKLALEGAKLMAAERPRTYIGGAVQRGDQWFDIETGREILAPYSETLHDSEGGESLCPWCGYPEEACPCDGAGTGMTGSDLLSRPY